MNERERRLNFLRDCVSCAFAIYGKTAPTRAYAIRVARQLIGIAAQESKLGAQRRQVGDHFRWATITGAWGPFQCEQGSVLDSLGYYRSHPDVAQRAAQWLFGQADATLEPLYALQTHDLLRLLSGWDRLAMVIARGYLLCDAKPIPDSLADQAKYWDVYWNRNAEHGFPYEYEKNWNVHVQVLWDETAQEITA